MTASTLLSTPKPTQRSTAATESIAAAAAVLAELRSVTDAAGRADLSQRLARAQTRIGDARLRIVVVGESKKGMSSLVNALVRADVCPTNATAGTPSAGIPVVVEFGATPSRSATRHVRTVALPAELLADGVVLVDTPGVTGGDSRRAATALTSVSAADAVLFVSDAGQEYTAPEFRFLEQVHQLCPLVACVINKIDSYGQWADIQQADRKHLTNAHLDLPILPVSTVMHQAAHRLDDAELAVESGIPQLLSFIRERIVNRADAVAIESVINDVRVVSDHLALALNTELTALRDPQHSAHLLDRIARARDAADGLRKSTANWQYVLGDGVTELTVTVDHDLRNRLRELIRTAEADIMKSDPAKHWAAFGAQLDQQIAAAVSDNFMLAHRLSIDLATKVARKFADDGLLTMPVLPGAATGALAEEFGSLESLDSGKTGVVQRAITSLRGSYGGVLMVGLATSLLGLALVNPYSIGAGLLLGANTFREDRKSLKARRQAEAKQAVARLLDEVVFQVNKESKQRLREVQRTLRDYFMDVAEETLRTVDDSLQAALDANATDESQRADRAAHLHNDLTRLRQLRLRAAALSPR